MGGFGNFVDPSGVTRLRASGGGSTPFNGVGLHLLADMVVAAGPAPIHWTATDYDTDSYLHASGNYVVVPFTGVYSVTVCTGGFDANGLDGYFDLSLDYTSTPQPPNATIELPYTGANGEFDSAIADTVRLIAGGTIEVDVNLRASGADPFTIAAAQTRFGVTFLGAP